MPVFVAVVRIAQCTLCSGQWNLEPQEMPERCVHCGSLDWEWGIESSDSRYIRQQISRLRKVLNPGAKSRARQQHGKSQHQAFNGPDYVQKPRGKGVDEKAESGED